MITLKIKTLINIVFIVFLSVIYVPFQAQAADQQNPSILLQQLVRVDKELNTAFNEALNRLDENDKQALQKEQLAWIRERDKKCGTAFKGKDMEDWLYRVGKSFECRQCVIASNIERIHIIREKYLNTSPFCKSVAKMIQDGTIDKYVLESRNYEPRGSEYLNLDIDGDGKPDKVAVESASEGSFIQVQLSSGVVYDLETSGFSVLIKFKNRIYALVTFWELDKKTHYINFDKISHRNLYQLTSQEIKIVCDNLKGDHDDN